MRSFPAHEIRVALIGYGFAGRTFHAPLIAAVPGLRLSVVGSRQPEVVRADFPGVAVVDAETAATHAEADLVVVAAPNDRHAPLARAALRAGKHVVVDKPFALTLAEARDLAALAKAQNRLISVFQNRRWDSDYRGIEAAIACGLVGEVRHFESRIDRYRPQVRDRWRERAIPGAGLWYDLGPHLIDQALRLFGLPDSVTAQLAVLREGAQADDWAHVVLAYADGPRVILHASLLAAGGSNRFTVHGSLGSLVKRSADRQEDQLRQGIRPGADGWGNDAEPTLLYDGSGAVRELQTPPGDYRDYYRAIRTALAAGGSNPVTPAQAIAVMAVLETATASHAQGKTLPLPLTAEERAEWGRPLDCTI